MRARLKDVLNVQVPVLIETKLKMHIPQGLQCKVPHLLSDSSSAGGTFLHSIAERQRKQRCDGDRNNGVSFK